ncbi:MAG: methyltransferase domain-containing protein [Desulfobacteraceae bacterium]|nr:methyltransferase domain-containing protein [Desulfobacteraceae bacterium]
MAFKQIINTTKSHYSQKIQTHGSNYKGVDWGSKQGQKIRFEQLLRFLNLDENITIIDYGCGYGALLDVLSAKHFKGTYQGYDISAAMIQKAKTRQTSGQFHLSFTSDAAQLKTSDYTLTSGIFNVKLETPDDQWLPYILHTLEKIADLSRKGFVFNALSSYAPLESREEDLYYADPGFLFDHCMKTFSGAVAMSHDYPLQDFTIFVNLKP